jgi:hypothetical protein
MSVELLYSYLIESSWIVLGGWTVLIVLASIVAFRRDLL